MSLIRPLPVTLALLPISENMISYYPDDLVFVFPFSPSHLSSLPVLFPQAHSAPCSPSTPHSQVFPFLSLFMYLIFPFRYLIPRCPSALTTVLLLPYYLHTPFLDLLLLFASVPRLFRYYMTYSLYQFTPFFVTPCLSIVFISSFFSVMPSPSPWYPNSLSPIYLFP